MLAPICLFTYNRLSETQQTIEALRANYLAPKSDLFVFSDGAKGDAAIAKVQAVRQYLKSVTGFKSVSVIESSENKGLANSVIFGVGEVVNKFGKIIVLEDDLITAPNFLDFMNQALVFYKATKKIQSISGFSLYLRSVDPQNDVYFQVRPFSWGWATWADRWDEQIFDKQLLKKEIGSDSDVLKNFRRTCGNDIVKMFLNSVEDKNDSWYVRWTYSHFKNNRYSVYPILSLVKNIGFGESGTHCKGVNSFGYLMDEGDKTSFDLIEFNKPENHVSKKFLNYFSFKHKVFLRLKLLRSRTGRKQLMSEIKLKMS